MTLVTVEHVLSIGSRLIQRRRRRTAPIGDVEMFGFSRSDIPANDAPGAA
jgi:hypothetical protein